MARISDRGPSEAETSTPGRAEPPTGAPPGPNEPSDPDHPDTGWGKWPWGAAQWHWDASEWHRHGRRARRPGHLRHRLRGPLHRSPDVRVVAGVCGGLSEATGVDVTLVRIGFALLTLGSGLGLLVYALAWLLLPLAGEGSNILSRALTDRRGIRTVLAMIPAVIVIQIIASSLHVGLIGSFIWPVYVAVAAAVLIRRNASDTERAWINDDLLPMVHSEADRHTHRPLVLRVTAGVALGVAGLLVLVLGHPSQAALRPVGGALLVIGALVVVFGPWWLSLVRDLIEERQGRAMAEERAQMAAHVHDSVLQTLALIQRSADDPQHVRRLARSQERELRSWLFEGRPPGTIGNEASTLAEAMGVLQHRVENDHGITVQLVVVGDCGLDDGLRALLDASGEATVNAAKWSGAPQVSLYAEVEADRVTLFVRDRGQGFEPDAVPEGRQGIAQSIRARVARFGGTAVIRSAPGQGAEVELSMPRRELVR